MPTYIIRKIDQDFWNRVKSKAALEHKTVRGLILELLASYVNRPLGMVQRTMTQQEIDRGEYIVQEGNPASNIWQPEAK